MPIGQHLARCMNCGKIWIVGDCIPSFCSEECSKAHTAWWLRFQEMTDPNDIRKEPHEADRA